MVGRISTAHNSRNPELAGNNCGVTGSPTAIGHNGRGALHDRLPVGIGHVSDQHIARLNALHLAGILDNPDLASANFLANRATLDQHLARRL